MCLSFRCCSLEYVDVKAERAFSLARVTASVIRRALHGRSHKRASFLLPQQPNNIPTAAAAPPDVGVSASKDEGETFVSVGCKGEMMDSLKEAGPLIAGLCGLPAGCLSFNLPVQDRRHLTAQDERRKDSFLSKVVLLRETDTDSNNSGDEARAVTLEIAVSSGSRGTSRIPACQNAPGDADRRRASLQRKLLDLKRRMEAPE